MKFVLEVPFPKKDEAKSFGARWDASIKKWYYIGNELPSGLKKWYPKRAASSAAPKASTATASAAQTSTPVPAPGPAPVSSTGATPMESSAAAPPAAPSSASAASSAPAAVSSAASATASDEADPYAKYRSVSDVAKMITRAFLATPEFSSILVKGEIAGKGITKDSAGNEEKENPVVPRNGRYYFDIKDNNAVLSCVIWDESILDGQKLLYGQQVAIVGDFRYYDKSGYNNLHVSHIEIIGQGASSLARLLLFKKLEKEGLFDPAHKKPIPSHPKTVGIITSKDGKAIQDIEKTIQSRNPGLKRYLYNAFVQGVHAKASILKGISVMDKKGYDVLIIGRGGGSDEELLKVFDDEEIARAVYNAVTPIISAVGHEGNRSIIDDAADMYAWTPTKAAELVAPNIVEDQRRLRQLKQTLDAGTQNVLKQYKLRLKAVKETLERYHPERRLREQKQRLSADRVKLNDSFRQILEKKKYSYDMASTALDKCFREVLEKKRHRYDMVSAALDKEFKGAYKDIKHRFEMLLRTLNGLSPTAKLVNGFGYISAADKPVTDIHDVQSGDELSIRIHNGVILSSVQSVTEDKI